MNAKQTREQFIESVITEAENKTFKELSELEKKLETKSNQDKRDFFESRIANKIIEIEKMMPSVHGNSSLEQEFENLLTELKQFFDGIKQEFARDQNKVTLNHQEIVKFVFIRCKFLCFNKIIREKLFV